MKKVYLSLFVLLSLSMSFSLRGAFAESCCETKVAQNEMPPQHQHQTSEKLKPESLKSLSPVYADYFTLSADLAADKLELARISFEKLAATLKRAETAFRPRSEDQKALARLRRATQAGVEAKNLDQARELFSSVSVDMLYLLEKFSNPQTSQIDKIYCGMAFNNKGAAWLQPSGGKIANPYMGSAMRQCGSIVKSYPPREGGE